MSLMKMVADSEGKSQVLYTQPAAADVTVANNEIALWIGKAGDEILEVNGLGILVEECLERLREVGTPTSGTGTYTTAGAVWGTSRPTKEDVVVATDAAFAIPDAAAVQLYVGDLFQPLPGTSITTAVKRLSETWLEQAGAKGFS